MDNTAPDIIVLKFADSKVPVFKESRNKDYIKYGEDNRYPEYLTHLYNKSAKHNAILSGKANYIFGEGYENGDMVVNRLGETLNDISRKSILDIEIYGGYRWEIIWNKARKVCEIYHTDFTTMRKGKDGGWWFKKSWDPSCRDEEEFIHDFDPKNPVGTQIFAYDEYRPMTRFYPLPGYIGSNNFIETDIEISKYYLSAIRNGMNPSKMIQFFKGEPTEDKKREIEARMQKKFAGAENAGRFLLVFNDANAAKAVEVNDLSGSDLDKMFVELNKTCSQEIFSGHLVTSPALFGIKTEGQLGATNELRTAYEIFINTYAKPKANAFDREVEYLLSYSNFPGEYELKQTDPIGLQFDVKDVMEHIPVDFILDKLGVPKDQRPQTAAPTLDSDAPAVNDAIKNLTAKQHQQVMRIIRQYSKGQLTELAAKALLRTGYGLSDEDINNLLGIETVPAQMSAQDEDGIIAMFDEYGDSKSDYEILKSKKVCFTSELEMEADEEVYIQEAFKTYDVTVTEDAILELIKKDPKITAEVIATTIGQTKTFVESKIASLVKRGYLETTVIKIGTDEVIERTVPEGIKIVTPPTTKERTAVSVKYSYEVKPNIGPELIPTSRPFCVKMIKLDRLYSRADIEALSLRLGYSVFDRKGGWWGKNPECRHRFVSHIVARKTKQS